MPPSPTKDPRVALTISPALEAALNYLRSAGYCGTNLIDLARGLENGLTPRQLVQAKQLRPEHETALNFVLPLAKRNPAPHRPHAPAFF